MQCLYSAGTTTVCLGGHLPLLSFVYKFKSLTCYHEGVTSYFVSVSVSGKIENLIKPGSSFEHVARWLTFCGAQSPFCHVSERLPSQANDNGSHTGVSIHTSSQLGVQIHP